MTKQSKNSKENHEYVRPTLEERLEADLQRLEEQGRGDGASAKMLREKLSSMKNPKDVKQMYVMGMRGTNRGQD